MAKEIQIEPAPMPTYAEIKRRLKEPIPDNYKSKKKAGAAEIDFVNISDVKDLLDERVGAGHWEVPKSEIHTAGGLLFMTVYLVIHASDGSFMQVGHGNELLDLKSYGDPSSNANAQAMRRAAESHGLAREMWRRELSDEQLDLPAMRSQIAALHTRAKELNRTESVIALYYSDNLCALFGDLTIRQAQTALSDTAKHLKRK